MSCNSVDILGLYLSEIGRFPLIDRDQEIQLAQAIEAGDETSEALYDGTKGQSGVEMERLCRVARKSDDAELRFVQSNLRLVVSIAKRHQASGLSMLDLIQEGNFGLMHAVRKFDWRLGFKFSTYATWWIRQAISRGIANTGRTIRLPVHVADAVRQVRRVRSRLESELGRSATRTELAIEAQMSEDTLNSLLLFEMEPLSLSVLLEGDGHLDDFAGGELDDDPDAISNDIEDPLSPSIFEIVTRSMWREAARDLVAVVDERKQEILTLRFGLDGGEPRTLEEVGEHFNLTRERIRQLERQALDEIRLSIERGTEEGIATV